MTAVTAQKTRAPPRTAASEALRDNMWHLCVCVHACLSFLQHGLHAVMCCFQLWLLVFKLLPTNSCSVMAPPTVPPGLRKMSVFGVTLAMALSMMPAERDLSCVELWAGVGSIARAAGSEGMDVIAMDINRIPGETNVSGPRLKIFCSNKGSCLRCAQFFACVLQGCCGWRLFAAALFS